MVHVFQHPQLSVGSLGVNGGLERSGDLLDGNTQVPAVSTPFGGVIRRTDLGTQDHGKDGCIINKWCVDVDQHSLKW